jgi:hypothetical protein
MTRSSRLERRKKRHVVRPRKLAAYETPFAKIEQDLAIIKWMLGLVIAGVASLIIKAFA